MRLLFLLLGLAAAWSATAQQPRTYPMAQGGEIVLPAGDLSFADAVVAFEEGDPPSKVDASRTAGNLIGPPDHAARDRAAFLSLGCGGNVTVQFIDNALINVPGPDLHVWEVGRDVEPMALAISADGTDWIEVGRIEGGTASVDISDRAAPGATYRFVRIADLECQGRGNRWPGADIDAVAAVGTVQRFVFDAGVLFEVGAAALSPDAEAVLSAFARTVAEVSPTRLVIEGHTDATGSDADNLALSQGRAAAVRAFLEPRLAMGGPRLETRGAGEAEPVAPNDTEEGRAANRRVEIIAYP